MQKSYNIPSTDRLITTLKKLFLRILSSPLLLYVCVIAFVLYFGLLTSQRHLHLLSLRLDLGNMDQTVWNVANGHGFVLTDPESDQQVSRLAYHADFLLVLLAPMYWIWSSPYMLLFIQVIVVGLGALPLYWIADKTLRSKPLALLFAVGYLLYPPMERALMYDFHAVTLATSFLLFAYWYMDTQKWGRFVLFALLSAICKEQIWIVVAMMGIYIAIWKKKIALGGVTAGVSLVVFYLLFWKVIPAHATANQHFALKYLSDFGGDMDSILVSMLGDPQLLFQTVLAPDRAWYLFQRFVPVGFLSIFAPWKLLFGSVDFGLSLLSSNQFMRSIDYQYNSVVTPFIFITSIEGLAVIIRLAKKKKHIFTQIAICVLVVTTLQSSYVWGVLPKGVHSLSWYYFREPAGYTTMKYVLENIDAKYSVSITNNLGAQVSQRRELYNFPVRAREADYVVVKLDDKAAWPSLAEQISVTEELRQDINYELYAHTGSFSAFRRKDL